MTTLHKLLTGAVALGVLVVFAASAAATDIQILNSTEGFRSVHPIFEFIATGVSVDCEVTLEGTFHEKSFVKLSGSFVGEVTRAIVASNLCRNGSARVLATSLPWAVEYASFTGTLPAIATFKLLVIGASFLIAPPGGVLQPCLAESTAAHPARFTALLEVEAGGLRVVERLEAERNSSIPLRRAGMTCEWASTGTISGIGNATVLGGTAKTRVELIT
jgi:hypothetical protein